MQEKKKYKIFLAIGIPLILLLIGGAVAWYVWSSEDDVIVNTSVCTPEITFIDGATINGNDLVPVYTKEEGLSKTIKVKVDKVCNTTYMNLHLVLDDIPDELIDDSFVFYLYRDDELLFSDSFSNYFEEDDILLLEDEEVTTEEATYTLYIYIDANYDNDPSMSGKSFSFHLYGEGTGAIVKNSMTAADYITNLYTNANKQEVENNGITYHTASGVSLMNDRLGGTTSNYDAGNIRYYGANPNNYVWLGDTYAEDMTIKRGISSYGSFETCMEEEGSSVYCQEDIKVHAGDKKLWRIIGVFDGKLKLVTDVPISTQGLSWDTSESSVNYGYGINEWSQSDLMKLLNLVYEDEPVNKSLYWNKGSGTVYIGRNNQTKPYNVSFANTGLSDSEKNMIDEETIWYTGAYNNYSYADVHYKAERENMGKKCTSGTYCNDTVPRTNEWLGKVGLISVSDYGYSVDLNSCNYTLYEYSQDDCSLNNWLVNGSWVWTMSPRAYSNYATDVFYVYNIGSLGNNYAGNAASVRPAVYLKSGVTISSGNGSGSNPYELSY